MASIDPKRLLILGGTSGAAALARAACDIGGDRLTVITSLAGRLPSRPALPGQLRIGGFGGVDGLAAYLREEAIDWVIDATHPFAATISSHAATACAALGVARLMLIRPAWAPRPGDRWIEADGFAAAAAVLPSLGHRVFLTTGPGDLAAFAAVAGVHFLVRLFTPPLGPLPLADCMVVIARPPFSIEEETALLREHRVEALVSKNSGGPTEAKLAAARALSLPVLMIRRPPPIPGEAVETAAAALAWLHSRLDTMRPEDVRVIGSIQPAVGELDAAQHSADQD